MKIGIDLSFLIQDQRGMGRYLRNILKYLLAESSHSYQLFYKNPLEKAEIEKLLSDLNPQSSYSLKLFKELPSAVLEICWYPWNRIDLLPQKGKKVLTLHDVAPLVFPYRQLRRWLDQKKDEQRLKKAAGLADLIYTVSNFSKTEIIKYLKVPEQKIKVIYSGVDAYFNAKPLAPEKRAELEQKFNFSGDFILYVGSDEERKNLWSLLKAFALLSGQGDFPYQLVLSGVEKESLKKYRNFLRQNQLLSRVIFTGLLQDEELYRLYRLAGLLVFPSFYEGFGLPLLEAMACGTPVVCSEAASLPEIAGQAALCFNPYKIEELAEKITLVLKDEQLRQQLIEKGFQRVKQFNWQKTVKEMLAGFRV